MPASFLEVLADRVLVFDGAMGTSVHSHNLPLSDYLHRPEPYDYVYYNAFFDIRVHELPGVMFVDNPVGLEVNGSLWSLGQNFALTTPLRSAVSFMRYQVVGFQGKGSFFSMRFWASNVPSRSS